MGCEFAAVVRRHGAAAAKPGGQLAARLDQVFELLFAVGGAQLGRWVSRADDRTVGYGLLERRPAHAHAAQSNEEHCWAGCAHVNLVFHDRCSAVGHTKNLASMATTLKSDRDRIQSNRATCSTPFFRCHTLPSSESSVERVEFLESEKEGDLSYFDVLRANKASRGMAANIVKHRLVGRPMLTKPTLHGAWAGCKLMGDFFRTRTLSRHAFGNGLANIVEETSTTGFRDLLVEAGDQRVEQIGVVCDEGRV